MEIVVVGAGSLGSLVGGLLATDHDVTLVGRDPHVSVVRERGLTVSGAIETQVWPAARTRVPDGGADLAVVAVKAYDTPAVARDLADVPVDAVCSLQNGLGNEATLTEHVTAPVLAGTSTYGARLVEPGLVECTGVGELTLGAREGGPSELADRIGSAFAAAGLETSVSPSMPRRLWEKLAVNAGINATTALARIENGALVDGPAGEPAEAAAREAARVARAEGIDLDEADATAAVANVAETTASNRSSMHQDLAAGRRTEVDAINGAVVDRARERGLDVPVNATLSALVRAWETERVERNRNATD